MPPRHTYWTIILEGKPTAFRAAAQDELLPTLKQLQARHPDAVLMWFARGRLWKSEDESRAAYVQKRPPGDRRGPTWRPGGTHEDPRARFKISRDEKRKRFRERLFGDDAPDDRDVPVDKLPEEAPPTTGAPPPSEPVAARPISKDRRPPREEDRPERPRSDRKPPWKPTGPGGPRAGGDRGWKPSRPAGQGIGGGDRGRKPSRPAGQGTGGGYRGGKPSRPAGQGTGGGERGWKRSRPAGRGGGGGERGG
jgi:hypothetical protein